jgi:2-amino-4-hydroxy-6-hydroxymethyldihydropteridine diphosphokinase
MPTQPRIAQEMTAWIGLGSNLGDGPSQIRRALKILKQDASLAILRSSPLYRTVPLGIRNQPEFTNCVAEISVDSNPLLFLQKLKQVERDMGRCQVSRRWGPREIDLDILLLDDRILFWPELTVPHPRMHRRAFVLAPLCDLAPDLRIPARGTVRACLERLGPQGVCRLPDENLSGN